MELTRVDCIRKVVDIYHKYNGPQNTTSRYSTDDLRGFGMRTINSHNLTFVTQEGSNPVRNVSYYAIDDGDNPRLNCVWPFSYGGCLSWNVSK